nr:zinc finger protein [Cryptococcus depauperatus CBS 7841]
MCKHILNAQVAIRAPCCKKFFDCPQCHAESQDHPLRKALEMAFLCKKCKKAFRKDMAEYEEADEYCPHCDNQYVIEAKEPQAMVGVEGEDARIDNRLVLLPSYYARFVLSGGFEVEGRLVEGW